MYTQKRNESQRNTSSVGPRTHGRHGSPSRQGAEAGTPLYLQRLPANSTPDIQRTPEDEEQQGFDYQLLPPSLRYGAGPFSVSATTSAAQLGYRSDLASYTLGYQYGGDIFAGISTGGFRGRFGVNPSEGNLSLGGSYGGFNAGISLAPEGRFGASFGYGAPLLPMPWTLGEQAGAAWSGAYSLGGLASDFLNDPLGAYRAHEEDIGALSTFGGTMSRLYQQQQQGRGALPFGFGMGLAVDPVSKVVFHVRAQGSF